MTGKAQIAPRIIANELEARNGLWYGPSGGYWSNLNMEENRHLLQDLENLGAEASVSKHFPEHMEVIFSPKRAGGLGVLEPMPGEVVVDAGCMWGALTVPLARAGCHVVAIDQTEESLAVLKQRLVDEGLHNAEIVCADLNKLSFKDASFDKVVVSGVLEWLPEQGLIELKRYYGKKTGNNRQNGMENPREIQLRILRELHRGLRDGGLLYLAIENRYDLFHFLGLKDPHCALRFVTFLPRPLQDAVSRWFLGRPYVNWTYSPRALAALVASAGFETTKIFYTFPDYRFPEYMLSRRGLGRFRPVRYKKLKRPAFRALCYAIEDIAFRRLRLSFLSPSITILARKAVDWNS